MRGGSRRVRHAMAKKRKRRGDQKKQLEPNPGFASPFKDLKKLLGERALAASEAKKAAPPPRPPEPTAESDDQAFLRALDGVRPLSNGRSRIGVEPSVNHTIVSEDAEVLAQLYDLVTGQGHFDLHGMIQPAAKEALRLFIVESVRKGHRAVLIVHGRGLGSPGGQPVLKHAVSQWLAGTLGGHVLAFTTARQQDGGAGAMYVLLRREKRRGPFDVLQGAKRRE